MLGMILTLLVTPATAQEPSVLFNEIAWAGTTTSANDEWIELYNPTATELNVTGYRIVAADGSPSVTLKGMLLPYGFFLLERTDDTTTPALADMLYKGALSNETETLRLYDASGTIIDEVVGWSAGNNETKQTMARSGTTWTFGVVNGTPGQANAFSEPPAPKETKTQKSSPQAKAPQKLPSSSPTQKEPVASPITASPLPIVVQGENRPIAPLVGLGLALGAAAATAFFFLPRVKRGD